MKFVISTNNKIKIDSLVAILNDNNISHDLITLESKSGVPDAPYNDDVPKGAYNRALYAKDQLKNIDSIYVGVETGIVKRYDRMYIETWCCIITSFSSEEIYSSYSQGICIPKEYEDFLWNKTHKELCEWADNMSNNGSQDLVSVITSKLSRKDTFDTAIKTALICAKII
jgi:non-canonical (house-cleaning) NTP pyrophosphatase